MNQIRNLALLLPMLFFAACTSEAGAAGTPDATTGSLTKVLEGVTDAETAKAAKTQLESLTKQLATGMAELESTGESMGEDAKSAMDAVAGKAKEAMNQITPELKESFSGLQAQITRLMNNEEIKKVLGPTLEKLKGMLPN